MAVHADVEVGICEDVVVGIEDVVVEVGLCADFDAPFTECLVITTTWLEVGVVTR